MSTHFEGLCDVRVMRMVRFSPKSILVIPSSLGELLVLRLGEGVRVVRVLVVRPVLSLLTHVELGLEAVGEGHAAVVHGLCVLGGVVACSVYYSACSVPKPKEKPSA